MKRKKLQLCALLLGFGLTAQAQQAIVTTGGDASGSGGTVAYSVGQMVYTTNADVSGSVAQGVQQPFEISIVTGTADQHISLELLVYPNPTSNVLTLSVGDGMAGSQLHFYLFDVQGKLIENREIANTTELIRMDHLSAASYFLKVTDNNKDLKTFKIIKY